MLELKAEFDGLVENELHKSYPAIRVGIQQRRAISIVPEALQRFMEKYPDVDVIFRDGNLGDLTCMYREGSVDFMVSIFRDELPDAVCQEIAKEPVLLALPDTHPAVSYAYSVEGDIFPHLREFHYSPERLPQVGDNENVERIALDVRGDDDRFARFPYKVVHGFPPAVIVDSRPAGAGPYVVELPDERPHAVGHVAPVRLHRRLHPFGLHQLAEAFFSS